MKLTGTSVGSVTVSRRTAAFTLVELMVASSISLLLAAGAMIFFKFGGVYLSGITAQSAITQQAGNAIEFIQGRVRFATSVSVSNDSSGSYLTLSFDDDPNVDSDNDGIPYNDKDHFERFAFIGVNGSTNTVTTNSLIYIPNITKSDQQVLIPAAVHNLPGSTIFTITNQSTVLIRFGIVDGYIGDHYQGVDIQATAVPLNRTAPTTYVDIIP